MCCQRPRHRARPVVEESGVVILLPGPPHELKAMFERQCLPRCAAWAGPFHPHPAAARHRNAGIRSRSAHLSGL